MSHQNFDTGPYAYGNPKMGRFYGTSSSPRRRTARALAAQADSHKGFSVGFSDSGYDDTSHIQGVRLEQGQGWVRTTRLAGEGVTPASGKSAAAVRRYNEMARESMRQHGMGRTHHGRTRPDSLPFPTPPSVIQRRAGMSVGQGQGGAYSGYPFGVFYGVQNPVRAAMRRRQFPSGRQHGFAVGQGQSGAYSGYPFGVFYGVQNPVRAAMRRRQFPSGRQHGFAVGGCGR